jgi:hypothetical protein
MGNGPQQEHNPTAGKRIALAGVIKFFLLVTVIVAIFLLGQAMGASPILSCRSGKST